MRQSKRLGIVFSLLSFTAIVAAWWVLAETRFRLTGIIPSPIRTLHIIWEEIQKDSFSVAVLGTLERSFISFFVSFFAACTAAVSAHYKKFIGSLINPFIVICRTVPTMALILILLVTVGSNMLPIAVAFLVVFPLCYENIRAAISETNSKLITMAAVFKVPKIRQITEIYIPAMLPLIFSSIVAGFGLNLKVVISAEVMGLPAMSIGHLILFAQQGFNFGVSFAWVVIAVILCFLCESILRIVQRLCMPYKYPDQKILKKAFKTIFRKSKNPDGNGITQ